MSPRNILVIGASGFIGRVAVTALTDRFHRVFGTYRSTGASHPSLEMVRVDLKDQTTIKSLIEELRPGVVVHLGSSAVAHQSSQEDVVASENLVKALMNTDAYLVVVSSDYVFDGTAGPYSEDDMPNPLNAYGQQKVMIEAAVGQHPSHLIIRTSLVFGWPMPSQHPNFVATAVGRLRRREVVSADVDSFRTPIYVGDLVERLLWMIDNRVEGLYNVAGGEFLSMHEVALRICDTFALDRGLIKVRVARARDVTRPRRCGLVVDKARDELGMTFPPLYQGLARMRSEEA